MIYYITGGERSGKSNYAQKLAESLSDTPIYLATSRIWDEDFKKRVERHISDRDDRWTTIEEENVLIKGIRFSTMLSKEDIYMFSLGGIIENLVFVFNNFKRIEFIHNKGQKLIKQLFHFFIYFSNLSQAFDFRKL